MLVMLASFAVHQLLSAREQALQRQVDISRPWSSACSVLKRA